MIINGKEIAQQIYQSLTQRVQQLSFKPVLCDVVVGNDSVTAAYVGAKQRAAEKLGLQFMVASLPDTATTEEIIGQINEVQDTVAGLSGLIVQLPLPAAVDTQAILNAVKPELDIDCLGQENTTAFYNGSPRLIPPTAAAILQILDSLPINRDQLQYVVAGQGALVGKPVAALLRARGYNVKVADSQTENLAALTSQADVVISGVGKPGFLSGDMVSDGAVVIDAGTSESGGAVFGDIDFDSVEPKASYITPVPGGVGPVTVAKLLENVVEVAERQSLPR